MKYIIMLVNGYYPDSILEYQLFNTVDDAVKHIKNVIYPASVKQLRSLKCTIVDDDGICVDSNIELKYPTYRVTGLEDPI